MKGKRSAFIRSVQALMGMIIGVGIFGIPYVLAQAGFAIGIVHILFVALVNFVVLWIYADMVVQVGGHARLPGIVRRFCGVPWNHAGALILFGSSWGALIAYIIIGGSFLEALCGNIFHGSAVAYQMIFFTILSFLLIGGIGFISHLESIFSAVLLAAIIALLIGAAPEIQLHALQSIHLENWFLPFGVILFAFGGISAVPEMAQILGRERHKLHTAILAALLIVTIIYLAFASIILSVTGDATTEESMLGLGYALGPWALYLGSFIGLFSVSTSFLMVGIAMIDTLVYDYRLRYLFSWGVVVGIPLLIFLIGARDFIDVIRYSGSIIGGLLGLLVLWSYFCAKKDAHFAKRTFRFPTILLLLSALVYGAGILLTIIGF